MTVVDDPKSTTTMETIDSAMSGGNSNNNIGGAGAGAIGASEHSGAPSEAFAEEPAAAAAAGGGGGGVPNYNDVIADTFAEEAPPGPDGVGGGGNPNKSSAAVVTKSVSSVSEAAEMAAGGWHAPRWIRWLEYPFYVDDPVTKKRLPEATGWGMDSAARGPLNVVGSYVGSAILRLAAVDAGCPMGPRSCTNDNVVYGLKPSSLLTLTTTVVGVIGALCMPVAGAIVDHTRYRKSMGIVSGFFAFTLVGLQMSVSQETWLFVLIVDGLQSFALLVHTTAVFAYLPDLTVDYDVLSHYTAHFNIRQFVSQFVYVSLVIIAGQVRGQDRSLKTSLQTAKDGAGMALGFGILFIGYAWLFLFRRRPALSQVPEGSTLLTTGFVQVSNTARTIWNDYHALKWYMFSMLWSPEAGNGVVLSMAVTFFTTFMNFATLDIVKLTLVFISSNVLGSIFSKRCCRWMNALNSYRAGLFSLGCAMAGAVATFTGPERRDSVFIWAVVWGFCMGWTYPSQRVLLCSLIPKGQETEMMGSFIFVGQILGWLPPLIFTILNENGVNMRWSMSVMVYFCIFAVICTLPMGSYQAAVDHATAMSQAKLDSIMRATTHQNDDIDNQDHDQQEDKVEMATAETARSSSAMTDQQRESQRAEF